MWEWVLEEQVPCAALSLKVRVGFLGSPLNHLALPSLPIPFCSLFGNLLQTHTKVAVHGLAGGRLIPIEEEFIDEVTSKAKYHGWGGGE